MLPRTEVAQVEGKVASGAGSDGKTGQPQADPGLALLARVGDFVTPLTRFGPGDLALADSRHEMVHVAIRQIFRVRFTLSESNAPGPLPAGATQTAGAVATAREAAIRLAAARAQAAPRLADWAAAHGDTPRNHLVDRDVFTPDPGAGHVDPCVPCGETGKIACASCEAGGVIPCAACAARGSSPCGSCETTGKVRCNRCYGLGHRLRDRKDGGQDQVPCTACSGSGFNACEACHGRGRIVCDACHGQKTLACPHCKGSGSLSCAACEGAGRRHTLAQVVCTITETLTLTPRASDPDVTAILKTLVTIDQALDLAQDRRTSVETSAGAVTRDTIVMIPVTTITVLAGGQQARVRGLGPRQRISDHANIAGLLLADDVARLEAATPRLPRRPRPRPTPELDAALGAMLASPANVAMAEAEAEAKDAAALEQSYAGAIAGDHVRRSAAATRKAVRFAYWAELARGPGAVLALPLLMFPFGTLVRGQPETPRTMMMLGVMLLGFGGAIAAHIWCARQLQARLRPEGAPRIARLLDRLNLTRNWLVIAGATSVVATLLVAALTAALFPPTG